MSVPGSNLLAQALSVIAPQTVTLRRFTGRTVNSIGEYVNTWDTAVPIVGSLQAVPQHMYEQLGLDWNKEYVTLYTSEPLIEVNRDGTGDRILYRNRHYLCESSTDWIGQDGWNAVIAVHVPAVP
jgi:hypothetical protein